MSNVLDNDTREQILAVGRLGWSLRRIEEATGIRRETASPYLKAAGIAVRRRGGRPREWPAKPATTPGVSTDSITLKRPPRAGWPPTHRRWTGRRPPVVQRVPARANRIAT